MPVPYPTKIEQGLALLESVKNDTVPNADALAFITDFLVAFPAEDSEGQIIEDPTSEQKATHFIRKVWDLLEESIRRGRVIQTVDIARTTCTDLFGPRP